MYLTDERLRFCEKLTKNSALCKRIGNVWMLSSLYFCKVFSSFLRVLLKILDNSWDGIDIVKFKYDDKFGKEKGRKKY